MLDTHWFVLGKMEIFAVQIFVTFICCTSLSERNDHNWFKLSEPAEMIFRMESDQTMTWFSGELPARAILQGGWRHVLKKKKKKKSTKVVSRSVMSITRPLSGAGIRVDESLQRSVSLSLPGARALTFNFSYPPSPLSLFPSISLHVFPSAFSAHQSDSPEVEDNPSSEQRVFHVLGRHAGESAASSLSSPQTPASASQPYCLSLLLAVLVFSPMFKVSFITEPIGSAGDVTNTASLCLDSTNTTQTPGRCWRLTAALTAAPLFDALCILLKNPGRKVSSEEHIPDTK